ncbi:hypothetical protein F5X99DRAFT_108007 [Biscogniauxia marginata]|nr:hypothetical protein F5X99DRAFT_108007 [Biscogniauxia marginata]
MSKTKVRSDFVDETPLEGPPGTTLKDFQTLKLRRFPGRAEDIKWLGLLGQGNEWFVSKASIDGYSPVAIKVFWITSQRRPHIVPRGRSLPGFVTVITEFPFKTESRTVDLIQKIESAMSEVQQNPQQTIAIMRGPKTREMVKKNLMAFSKEARDSSQVPASELEGPPPPVPPFPRCHGWLRIDNSLLPFKHLLRQKPDKVGWSWAIVYEYVPSAVPDIVLAQKFFDFSYDIGLVMTFKADNWHGGRLVDMNDIKMPTTSSWQEDYFTHFIAANLDWET